MGWGSWKAVFPEVKIWHSFVNSTVRHRISMAQCYHGIALLIGNFSHVELYIISTNFITLWG